MSQDGDSVYVKSEEQEEDPLTTLLQQLLKETEGLQRENDMLDSYLAKVDPNKITLQLEEEAHKKKKISKKGKVEVKKETFQRLTDEEKNDIASHEIEVLQAEIDNIKKAGEKDIEDIKTLMEEVDMRIAETKKDTYEFKRDIIIGAENSRTGKTVAEKMIRFMEDKLRQKDTMIEKLRLKNTTMKAQIQKLEQQLQHKEEMGEVLHLVDFDQLKIENQQYMEKIEEKNNELLKLKLSTSRTVQVLNSLKFQLSELVGAGQQLRKLLKDKASEQSRFDNDLSSVGVAKVTVEKTVRRLQAEQEDFDQPQIMDYIRVKHEVAELEKQVIDWQRKIEIMEMEKTRTRALLRTVTGLTNNPNSGRSTAVHSPNASPKTTMRV